MALGFSIFRNYTTRLSELHSTCPEKNFEGNKSFFKKKKFRNYFGIFSKQILDFWQKVSARLSKLLSRPPEGFLKNLFIEEHFFL